MKNEELRMKKEIIILSTRRKAPRRPFFILNSSFLIFPLAGAGQFLLVFPYK
jgi:hypothetical protein